MLWRCRVYRGALLIGQIMLDVIYIGTAVLFFVAFALYALGCEKL
jgi:hypothetical protein